MNDLIERLKLIKHYSLADMRDPEAIKEMLDAIDEAIQRIEELEDHIENQNLVIQQQVNPDDLHTATLERMARLDAALAEIENLYGHHDRCSRIARKARAGE